MGHYHGVLKNWLQLQHEYECFFFVADWHALTTHYEEDYDIDRVVMDIVVDWLAVGVNPNIATIFIQSKVPEHAELHLLLSMVTPVSWLERVPSYKDQQTRLNERELTTYGFLGYPVLQSADILAYRAGSVPVGADQVAHVEITREIARRFNHVYGRELDFEQHAEAAVSKMGKKAARLYRDLRKRYQECGDAEVLERAQALLGDQKGLSLGDRARLFGYLEGTGRIILPEPQALLTSAPRVPGVNGEKMSKSYNNTIHLGEAPDAIAEKIRTMKTDPARVRRSDPGNPDVCPLFELHRIYSDDATCDWAAAGCRSAGIGCLDCKAPVIDAIVAEQTPIRERAAEFANDPDLVQSILLEGSEAARDAAKETLEEVRAAIGIDYR